MTGGKKIMIKMFSVSHFLLNRGLLCHSSSWWQSCAMIFPDLELTEKLWILNISGMWWSSLSNPGKFCQLPSIRVTPVSTHYCPLEAFEVRFKSNPNAADDISRLSSSMAKDNINLLCQISQRAAFSLWSECGLVQPYANLKVGIISMGTSWESVARFRGADTRLLNDWM